MSGFRVSSDGIGTDTVQSRPGGGFSEDLAIESLPECVSFDVFDTLVLRPFLRPTDVFRHMESVGIAPEGYADARIKAEADARRELRREVRLTEIYSRMGPGMQIPDREVEVEVSLCRGNPETLGFAERLMDAGKRVIAVSDNYLPQKDVAAILKACGAGIGELYVSSEPLATKYDGDLYPIVLSETGLGPKDIVHIGDTHRPDVRMAAANGIRGVLYIRQTDRYFQANPWAKPYAKAGGLGRSTILGMDILRWCGALGEKGDDVHEMGFRYGGPIISAYSRYLESVTDPGSRMLFVSRDGYNLMRAYDVLYPGRNDMVYVHAQRILSYMFTDDYIPFGPLELPGRYSHSFDHKKVARWMRYVLGFFEEDLRLNGIPSDNDELQALYNSRVGEIDALRRAGAEDYRRYVKSFSDVEDLHLVDCTTMKFTSQRLLEKMAGREMRGHYYVSLGDAGLSYDAFKYRDRFVFGWRFVNVPEFFMSSPELPITGWRGGPRPMEDPPEWEKYRCSMYGEVTAGEVEYAKAMKDVFGGLQPKLGYDEVTEWSLLSAERDGPYRCILDRIKWASSPDHSDWTPLLPDLRDIPFIAKKLATDLISKMNSMRRHFDRNRLGVPLPGPVEDLGEPVPYHQEVQRREQPLEPPLQQHLRPARPLQHVQVLRALHVPVEAAESHVPRGPDAEQCEPLPQEALAFPAGDVLLKAVVPSDLGAPSAVAVLPAVADGPGRDHVLVEGL
ncbi:MAG: hypothetical protein J5674_00815, partial [Candidatus Methanomethylophilaceae archaeon]|nr:hypothetical protein [Candidatus Methanomethylophilaceae archaeon]